LRAWAKDVYTREHFWLSDKAPEWGDRGVTELDRSSFKNGEAKAREILPGAFFGIAQQRCLKKKRRKSPACLTGEIKSNRYKNKARPNKSMWEEEGDYAQTV